MVEKIISLNPSIPAKDVIPHFRRLLKDLENMKWH